MISSLHFPHHSISKGSFIDISLANHPSIQPFRHTLETLSPLQMFDGRPSSSGPITHIVNLPLVLQNGLAPLLTTLYVTRLAGADIVLGDDWLAKCQAILNHAQCRIQLTLPSSSPSITSSNAIPIASPSRWGSSSFSGQPAISSSSNTPNNHSPSLALDPSVNNDTLLRAVSFDSFPAIHLTSMTSKLSDLSSQRSLLLKNLRPKLLNYLKFYQHNSMITSTSSGHLQVPKCYCLIISMI